MFRLILTPCALIWIVEAAGLEDTLADRGA
jgi:hypothetical protein